MRMADALEKLIASPDLCSKRWVWEQYDHIIGGNTVQRPGGDAAVVRVNEGPKALALTADVTPRYCEADPYRRRQAGGGGGLAQYHARSAAVRSRSPTISISAIPSGPRSWGNSSAAFAASAKPARALDFPIVSGNVSLYNETNGRAHSADARPSAASACSTTSRSSMTIAFKAEGESILLVGDTRGWLGQSLYLREICGREEGAPPPVDLAAERRHGEFVRALIRDGLVTAVHDISDGGLLVALAEMAMVSHIGACSKRRAALRRTLFGSARIRPATC